MNDQSHLIMIHNNKYTMRLNALIIIMPIKKAGAAKVRGLMVDIETQRAK